MILKMKGKGYALTRCQVMTKRRKLIDPTLFRFRCNSKLSTWFNYEATETIMLEYERFRWG